MSTLLVTVTIPAVDNSISLWRGTKLFTGASWVSTSGRRGEGDESQ